MNLGFNGKNCSRQNILVVHLVSNYYSCTWDSTVARYLLREPSVSREINLQTEFLIIQSLNQVDKTDYFVV